MLSQLQLGPEVEGGIVLFEYTLSAAFGKGLFLVTQGRLYWACTVCLHFYGMSLPI